MNMFQVLFLNLIYYVMLQDKSQAVPLTLNRSDTILFNISEQVLSNVPRFKSGIFVIYS